MQGLIGITRIYLKHAIILLATGLLFQLAAVRSDAQDKPKRPRITGIDHIRIYVSDIDKSRAFYRKYLGLQEGGIGCRGVSRPCFSTHWADKQAIELEPAPSSGTKNWVAEIAFRTDNIEQMRRYLVANGMKPSPIGRVGSEILYFNANDPEGNVVGFVQWHPSLIVSDPPPPPINGVGTRLLHAGFVVKGIATENKFYLDLLGFRLYWYGGFKDDGVDWYEIQVPDGSDWIEYMLNIPANADHRELGVQNHFSLGAKDIHAAADQLHKNGLLKFDGPEIGRDGKWGLDAYDPDGTRVEVMEFRPTKTPCCHPYTAPHPTP
jgi:catechol 2,3-dioxygenase-like lactoylglutathione lyase family enzyme